MWTIWQSPYDVLSCVRSADLVFVYSHFAHTVLFQLQLGKSEIRHFHFCDQYFYQL